MARVRRFLPNSKRIRRAARKGMSAVATRAWGLSSLIKFPGDIKKL
jgi:hypothetical protein